MSNDNGPRFSQIVCSSHQVQVAFLSHNPTRFWWRIILKLHGKPVNPALSYEERTKRVADGFRFYAWLYRLLSVLFLLLVPTLISINLIDSSNTSPYWTIASLLAGLYLWCVSGLGYTGAKLYAKGDHESRGSLVAFMVMIVAFLGMFLAVISVVCHHSMWLPEVLNVVAASSLFVLGVGSYMIEIIYLVTERPI